VPEDDERLLPSPTERFVARSRIEETGLGRPLSRRALQRERTVENYLRGEQLPRYITRAREIEKHGAMHLWLLAEAREELRGRLTGWALEQAWTTLLEDWDFSATNALVDQHNEWYPVERDLPMDPRTGRYIGAFGIGFERHHVDAAWARGRLGAAVRLFHVAPAVAWRAGAAQATYEPEGFDRDGFVHLATDVQLPGVLERFFAGRRDLLALELEHDALTALGDDVLRWEPGTDGAPGLFPHLHAPLPRAAVLAERPVDG
jgi:uncharacterized protein (DUF952 family)